MVAAARVAQRAALVVLLLVLAVVTAACGGADPAGSPPPQTSGTSPSPCSPVVGQVDDEVAALVGLPEAEATRRAQESGLQVRVASRGAECFALTADYRPDRVNLALDEQGEVRAAGRG